MILVDEGSSDTEVIEAFNEVLRAEVPSVIQQYFGRTGVPYRYVLAILLIDIANLFLGLGERLRKRAFDTDVLGLTCISVMKTYRAFLCNPRYRGTHMSRCVEYTACIVHCVAHSVYA